MENVTLSTMFQSCIKSGKSKFLGFVVVVVVVYIKGGGPNGAPGVTLVPWCSGIFYPLCSIDSE